MLKILKYEFRKNAKSLSVMLLVAAGLFLLAPLGKISDEVGLTAISVLSLMFYALAAFLYVLLRGITAYSGELRSKTGYLLIMVPRSTMSILFGKLLFSLVFAALMLAVTLLALGSSIMISFSLMLESNPEIRSILDLVRISLEQMGFDPAQFVNTALFFAVEFLSGVLAVVGISYLSVTLSATLLSDGRGRGFVSFLFFLLLLWLTAELEKTFTPEVNQLYVSVEEALRAALPVSLLLVILTFVFTAASAILLKKKVSL